MTGLRLIVMMGSGAGGSVDGGFWSCTAVKASLPASIGSVASTANKRGRGASERRGARWSGRRLAREFAAHQGASAILSCMLLP